MIIQLKDGVRYLPYAYHNEDDMEKMIIEHYKYIFGEDSIILTKREIKTRSGIRSIPDAFVLSIEDKTWYLVEVELEVHPLYEHIVAQISKFNSAIKNAATQKALIKAFYDEIKSDPQKNLIFQLKEIKELYKFISEALESKPKIIILIDNKSNKLDDVCDNLPLDSKVVEFKTYSREGIGIGDHIHSFESLKFRVPTKIISPKISKKTMSYKGKSISAFQFGKKEYEVQSWKNLLIALTDIIYALYKSEFEKVLGLKGRNRPYFTYNKNDLRNPQKISNTNIFVETNLSADSIVKICYRLLAVFGYSDKDLKIYANHNPNQPKGQGR